MCVKQYWWLLWGLLSTAGFSSGNFPLLDVDTNMRIVLVPYDTPAGTIIYRLRASDSDNNFPLQFEVLGALGKSLLSLNFLGCTETESLCQADVILMKSLDKSRTYEFQLQVKDTTGDYTKVHAVLQSTFGGSYNFNPLFGPRIIHLAEDCQEGTTIERFEVVKNELNSRIAHLEIRDKAEKIGLKQRLVSNNRTEGTLFLKGNLDYETQPWFTFQLLAMNAWTNTTIDTRNILVSTLIVAVHDIQDTPPQFTLLPSATELNSSIKMGDLLIKVEAVDGDKQNKRLIRYGFLTDNNPFVVFFDLDPMTGEIRLRKNITELARNAKPNEPIKLTVIAEEIASDNGRFGRSVSPTLERTMGNITFWFGSSSDALGPPIFSSDRYVGQIQENSLPGAIVNFGTSSSLSVSHPNQGEIIALSFTGSRPTQNPFIGPINSQIYYQSLENVFELIPSQGMGNFSFEVRVLDGKAVDYEVYHEIKLTLMATTHSELSVEASLTIHIQNVNDNSPKFSQSEYRVDLQEHAPLGTKVIQVKATDTDGGGVMYSSLIGSDAFHLDPESGEITVDRPELLDRELEPEIRLHIEAKDGGYSEFSSDLRNMATTTVIVKLLDRNDNSPEFLQKYYQTVLNPDLGSLKVPLFVKAFDPDEGTNGQVKYQSLDPKFYVDATTGEVKLRGTYHRSQGAGDGPYLGAFRVKAYDLGSPQQSTETVVQLFSEEMVTREIQFVFPASPEKIRKNQTNIEKMLSSLTGGIVGINKITPYGPSQRSGLTNFQDEQEGRSLGDSSATKSPKGFETRKSEGLSSEKSLVTATVQYPVSATPTRVDLAAFQREYGNGEVGRFVTTSGPPQDNEMIKLYEAENRALFWILITFLFLLLILFAIFLCCIYCPCCWLYGHCYSKGDDKSSRSDRELIIEKGRRQHHGRKTYPATEASEDSYDNNDPESSYRNKPRRREAWSGEEHKRAWRSRQRYRDRPPTPHSKERRPLHGGGGGGRTQDVSLEDWDYDPNLQRSDRAEEIGPRWQNMQHQPQTITVPVPMSMMPLQVQQQLQQQIPPQQPQRRVGYVGHAHPGDEDFVRRQETEPPPQSFTYREVERSQIIPRHYPGSGTTAHPPLPDTIIQRETRFFKTETGEVLQFADFEGGGEEGKELLMKRYIDDQQLQQVEGFSAEGQRPHEEASTDRPRAARPQKGVKQEIINIIPQDEILIRDETKPSKPKKSKLKKDLENKKKEEDNKPKPSRRSQSLSEESQVDVRHSDHEHKTPKSKSLSRSMSKSKSKSRSKSRSRSNSPKNAKKSPKKSDDPPKHSKHTKRKEDPPTPRKERKNHHHKKSTKVVPIPIIIPDPDTSMTEVDINIIPPSSAAMSDEIINSRKVSSPEDEYDSTTIIKVATQQVQQIVDEVEHLVNEDNDDEDSGIGGVALKRNKMMEKKSVFTIAYDEVATKTVNMRADSANNSNNEEDSKVTP